MNHTSEFKINNFRGLYNLKIAELGQINLFVGNNNSGKTSVLEALLLYCDPLNWRRWKEAASQREANIGVRSSIVDRITWLFSQQSDQEEAPTENTLLSFESSGNIPIEKVTATYEKFNYIKSIGLPKEISEYRMDERDVELEGVKVHVSVFENFIQPTLFGDNPPLEEIFTFSDDPFLLERKPRKLILPVQLINPFSHRTNNLTSILWSEVVEAELKKETIELLRYFDPDILDVDFISPSESRQLISVKHAKLGRAPLHTFGDGLRRVFALATTIPRVRGGILLIDEIETAIHAKALDKTFEWLVNACVANNVQLFATTHSLEALDAILESSREQADFVVYRLQQEKEQTVAKRFDKDLALRLREELGMELRY